MLRGTGWMYEGANSTINKEEYLLGKQIGNNFEAEGTAGQINAVEYDVAPPSIFASRATHQVDLARKLMEDPLVAIKKREVEDRKRLMDNPMKMKQLQEHLQSLEKKSKKSKKHKKEKKSKHKKRERNRSRSRSIKRERSRNRSRSIKRERSRSRSRPRKIQKQQKRRDRSRSTSSDSDDDLDLKLLKKIQAMERGGGGEGSDESDEYESDDEAEERKKQAILAAGVDPDNVDAPMFSNTARKKGRENSPEKGKGDWDCLKCGNWNFVRRTECFKCNTKKGEGKAREHAPLFVPIPIAKIKAPVATPVLKKKPGGGQKKPGETGPGEASPPSGGRGGGDRPGDWRCLKQGCGYSNFASRSSCNKCSTAKGEAGEDKPVRAAYQRKEGRASTPGGTLLGSPSPPRRRHGSGTPPRENVRGAQGPGRGGRRRSPSRERRRSRSPRAGNRGRRSPSTPPRYRRNRSPTSPPRRQEGAPGGRREGAQNTAPTGNKGAKGLSDAEKQAKLAEMMANADWRDGQRTARVGKYREEQAKEDEEAKREHDPGFLNRELKRAHENLTIEGRITSNKHNIQRGVGVMDKNFAKR